MTPSTLVRALRPISRGPFTFVGMSALFAERAERAERGESASSRQRLRGHRCVACQDDGSPCGLPARYVDMKRGGHVCHEHKPERKQEALQLV